MSKFPYEKYTSKDGMVAVLFSPGFGAGWSTWAHSEEGVAVMFDREIVELLLKEDKRRIRDLMERKYPDFYVGGLSALEIYWLSPGTKFKIREYDGSESVEVMNEVDWFVA